MRTRETQHFHLIEHFIHCDIIESLIKMLRLRVKENDVEAKEGSRSQARKTKIANSVCRFARRPPFPHSSWTLQAILFDVVFAIEDKPCRSTRCRSLTSFGIVPLELSETTTIATLTLRIQKTTGKYEINNKAKKRKVVQTGGRATKKKAERLAKRKR